jgi:hypothetical protein
MGHHLSFTASHGLLPICHVIFPDPLSHTIHPIYFFPGLESQFLSQNAGYFLCQGEVLPGGDVKAEEVD